MLQALTLFCGGTFFGAALYISVAQHPACLEAGVGGRFFPPMYKRASALQIGLAVIGFIGSIMAWINGLGLLWLIGGILLISVVPITLILIKPINDQLLAADNDPDSDHTEQLLKSWGPKHWVRTIVSGLAFLLHLYAVVG